MIRLLAGCTAVAVLGLCLAIAPPVAAKSVVLMPKTTHSALTMTTDESYGFLIDVGRPMDIDMVGPGELTITVRLNSAKKRASYAGTLEIRRANKLIKSSKLKLFRSRVGAYREDKSLQPSTPKVFKIKVPSGLQSYSFGLKAARHTSMTVRIDYDSNADQGAALGPDELALVPLLPPDGAGGTPGAAEAVPTDDIPLVPLVPVVEEPVKPKPVAETKPAVVSKPVAETKPAVVSKPVTETKPAHETKVAAATKPVPKEKPGGVTVIETKPEQPPTIEAPAPAGEPIISIGLKAGQISPLQTIGGTTYTVGLDLRYILPVFAGRLTIGLEGSFHQYELSIRNADLKTSLALIPISLNLFYRFPLGWLVEPFVGLGGDLIVVAQGKTTYADQTETSGTGIGYGGHISAGLEAKLGPGFLLLEVRGGMSQVSIDDVINKVNGLGLSTVVGYRFVF